MALRPLSVGWRAGVPPGHPVDFRLGTDALEPARVVHPPDPAGLCSEGGELTKLHTEAALTIPRLRM